MDIANFGRFISIITTALTVMELPLLLQKYFFSFRYLSSRALRYFECNICYGFWKALISGSDILLHFSAVSNVKVHIFVSLIIF